MHAEILDRWTTVLRSDRFTQGQSSLIMPTSIAAIRGLIAGPIEYEHCCLGVLCELAVEAGIIEYHMIDGAKRGFRERVAPTAVNPFDYNIENSILPRTVADWAGLSDCDPLIRQGEPVRLSYLNDSKRYSFAMIADAIEEHFRSPGLR